jgi:FtsZ-binding cell division protein ZapB
MEIIHQQVQRKKEKMAQLVDLQMQIDEATEEVRHLAQDEQDRRPQHRELHQEGLFNDDGWYDDFNHDTTFDDASPLAAELQAIPWPPSYKPPQLPMYDGHSDPKQFLMSYEATISSYGGNAAVMAKSFVMAVWNVAQTWLSHPDFGAPRPGREHNHQVCWDQVSHI